MILRIFIDGLLLLGTVISEVAVHPTYLTSETYSSLKD